MASKAKLNRDVTYPGVDMTPQMVAQWVKDNPWFGRDHDLARGWLVAIEAGGESVVRALQDFLDQDFLVGNNNGVPGWHVHRLDRAGREPNGGESAGT